jgi:hypothetical protein
MFPLNMVITRVNSTLFPDKSKYRIGEYIYISHKSSHKQRNHIVGYTVIPPTHIIYNYIYTLYIYIIIYEIIISVKISHIQTPEAATLFPSSSPSWHGQVPARARGKPNVCGSCSERETIWLVVSTPLKNMKVSWDYYSYMDK